MHPIAYLFMGFGAILALLGIALFVKMGTQGTSKLKLLGFEFQLGGSALVVFVMGVLLFLVPIIYSEKLPQRSTGPKADPQPPEGSTAPKPHPAQARFVIVDMRGGLRLYRGVFDSIEECDARVAELGDSKNYARCRLAPERVWGMTVSTVGGRTMWEFHSDPASCLDAIDRHIIEAKANRRRPGVSRCAEMTFDEALRRLREGF